MAPTSRQFANYYTRDASSMLSGPMWADAATSYEKYAKGGGVANLSTSSMQLAPNIKAVQLKPIMAALSQEQTTPPPAEEWSTTTKAAVAVGGAAVLGLIVWALMR